MKIRRLSRLSKYSGLGLISSLLLCPSSGFGFDTAGITPASISPPAVVSQTEKVVTFNNESLDRMFGKDRVVERSRSPMREGSSYGTDAPAVAPNESLLRGITRETKARRAAALRLAEKGRMLLQKKEYQKGVAQLEQALSLEANPFIYYYLAKGHYYLGNSDRASGFLAAAEAGLVPDAWWTGEFIALRTAISSLPEAQQPAVRQNVSWVSQY
jgi:hypothetical protein